MDTCDPPAQWRGERSMVGASMEIRMMPDKIDREDERDEEALKAVKEAPPQAEPDDDPEWWMPLESDLTGPNAAFHHRPGEEHPPDSGATPPASRKGL